MGNADSAQHPPTCHCEPCRARVKALLMDGDIAPGPDPSTLPPITDVRDLHLGARYAKVDQDELTDWLLDEGHKASFHLARTRRDLRSRGFTPSEADTLAQAFHKADGDQLRELWRKASDIELRPVPWLWRKRLAPGEVTLMSGDPGAGKSIVAATLAATVTTGADFPDGASGNAPGAVCWLGHAGEDSAEFVTVPRFVAAGGDLKRLEILDTREAADLATVCASAAALRPALAVIDSWAAWNEGSDDNDAGEVRARFGALQPLRAAGAAVLVIAHDRKADVDNAIHRAAGSVQLTAAPRMALRVADGVVSQTKGNLGGCGPALPFTIEGASVTFATRDVETARVEWLPADTPLAPHGGGDEGSGGAGRRDGGVSFEAVVGYVMAGGGPFTVHQVGQGIGAHPYPKRQAVGRHLNAAVKLGKLAAVDVKRAGRTRTGYQPVEGASVTPVTPVTAVGHRSTDAQSIASVASVTPIRVTDARPMMDTGATEGNPADGPTDALAAVNGTASGAAEGSTITVMTHEQSDPWTCSECMKLSRQMPCQHCGHRPAWFPDNGHLPASGADEPLELWQEALLHDGEWFRWSGFNGTLGSSKLLSIRHLSEAEKEQERAAMLADRQRRAALRAVEAGRVEGSA